MPPADLITAAVAACGVVFTIVGGAFTYLNNRRGQFERVLEETAGLTTGETRDSRHLIGALFETSDTEQVTMNLDQTAAYFDVLWAFERLFALFVSLRSPFGLHRMTRPQVLLLLTSRGAIQTWSGYSSRVDDRATKHHASNEGLRRLALELRRLELRSPDFAAAPTPEVGPAQPAEGR